MVIRVQPIDENNFIIDAALALPWNKKYSDQNSEIYQIFALNLKYYVESLNKPSTFRQNSSILIDVTRISKAYDRRDEGNDHIMLSKIEVSFNMTTVNFPINLDEVQLWTDEHEENIFDKMFEPFLLDGFKFYFGDTGVADGDGEDVEGKFCRIFGVFIKKLDFFGVRIFKFLENIFKKF